MTDSGGGTPATITSPANARVRWLVGLRRRRTRDAERLTVVEGLDELSLALDAGVAPRQLYWCHDLVQAEVRDHLLARVTALGTEVVRLGRAAFGKASYRDSPDGWLAVVEVPEVPLDAVRLGPSPLVLICEAIEKPGNLGAMLRTAEAVGVDAVVAASPVADWGNPNVVRASKGTVFAVQVASGPTGDVVDWLRRNRLPIVVATPDARRVVTDLDLTGGVAVVVGAEHAGVGSRLVDSADSTASLPMVGRVNSLNVAATAAVVLYEVVRQRSAGRAGRDSRRLGPSGNLNERSS
jgi:TrmH family RNA methyltransferase